jgi:hypothetical protein
MTQIKEKIAFKLSTPEAVEYANGHKTNDVIAVISPKTYFHFPAFDWAGIKLNFSDGYFKPGYTDVTPNFLEDYYRPWKDKLASDNAPSISGGDAPFDSGNTDRIQWEYNSVYIGGANLNKLGLEGWELCTIADEKMYILKRQILTPKQ